MNAITERRYEPALDFGDVRHLAVNRFLVEEAAILDAQLWERWLELLTDDVRYVMPVRVTTALGTGYDSLAGMAHFDEDRHSLQKRVQRLATKHAWTEDPPSRTRHIVTNVRTLAGDNDKNNDNDNDNGNELRAESSLLLFRSRGDDRPAELLCAKRCDQLRPVDGGLLLARREITIEESVLRTQNLAIFL